MESPTQEVLTVLKQFNRLFECKIYTHMYFLCSTGAKNADFAQLNILCQES